MNSKERCLATISGEPTDRRPVFPLLMFLAADRAGLTYRQFATDGAALAAAQLKSYGQFDIDAITACSDAFRVSADLGGQMVYPETKPPYLAAPIITCDGDLAALARPDATRPGSRMADRTRAVEKMVRAIGNECLVLGWVDMPFAEACSVCGVAEFLMMTMDRPDLAQRILEFLTDIVIDFSLVQLAAGAPMIGAGDAAASLIGPDLYRRFALSYEQRVAEAIHDAGGLMKLHICGNTSNLLDDMIHCGADLFNVDHMVDFASACRAYGAAGKAFKGNLDPVADFLRATSQHCHDRAADCIRQAQGTRFMLSAGCELPADVPDEVLHAFCAAATEAGETV